MTFGIGKISSIIPSRFEGPLEFARPMGGV
jgi:hypothetical protein